MTKRTDCRKRPFDTEHYTYCGRSNRWTHHPKSKWANPFIVGRDGDRRQVIAKFKAWLLKQKHLMDALPELKGKNLGCWCDPDEKCHVDVLVDFVNKIK